MEWEWWQVVIGLVMAIFAIRITATINVTELLKHRRDRQLQSLQALCAHVAIEMDAAAERITIQGLATSPPGTHEWFCERCLAPFPGGLSQAESNTKYWTERPKQLAAQQKKFLRRAKRQGFIR